MSDINYQYEIFQLPVSHPSCFRAAPVAPIKDYKLVYEGELAPDRTYNTLEVLDLLFEQFNIYRPENYRGRSLSVSDVVRLRGTCYVCKDIGWEILEDCKCV